MERPAKRFVTLLAVVFTSLFALACGGGNPLEGGGETISRTQFIDTYVALRKAALQSLGGELTLDRQRELLDSMGVTADQLVAFVEYWGDDGEVMVGIWEEANTIMQEARTVSGEELEQDAEEQAPRGGEYGDEEGGGRIPLGEGSGEGVGSP